MSGCYMHCLQYVFDIHGHTKEICTAKRYSGEGVGRRICPHYNGKCPALKSG